MKKVSLYFVSESEKARKYCRIPKSRNPAETDFIWIPKSLIEGTTRYPAENPGDYPLHIVRVVEWFADKNNL